MSKTRPKIQAKSVVNPWPMVRIGDVCEIAAGNSAPQNKDVFLDGTHPFIRTSDVGEIHFGIIVKSRDKLNDAGIAGLRLFPKGSVLFPKSGASTYLNHRVLLGVNAYVVSHLAVIIPSEQVYPQYLLYALAVVDAKTLMQDSSYPALRTAEIGAAKFPLPPLSEQKEIVARLERELAAVEKMKKGFEALAETAKQELKVELKEVFEEISRGGAETRRLGDVCELIPGFAFKSKEFGDFNNRVIRIGNINPPSIAFSDGIGVNIQAYSQERLSKYVAIEGDCLVAMTGATIGKMGVMGVGRAYVNQRVLIIRARSMLSQMYLANLLLSASFREFTEINADSKAAQPNISAGTIGSYAIPLPPISTQREVVARLDLAKARAEKLEAKAREGVVVCETMRKAILKEAFE